jgi:hypothetical protein
MPRGHLANTLPGLSNLSVEGNDNLGVDSNTKLFEKYEFKDDPRLDFVIPSDDQMEVEDDQSSEENESSGSRPKTLRERIESRLQNPRYEPTSFPLDPFLDECEMDDIEKETLIFVNPIVEERNFNDKKLGEPIVIRRPQNTDGFQQYSIPYFCTLEESIYSCYNVADREFHDWKLWDKINRLDYRPETFKSHGTDIHGRCVNSHSSDQISAAQFILGEEAGMCTKVLEKDFVSKDYLARDEEELNMQRAIQHSLNIKSADKSLSFKRHNDNERGGAVISHADLSTDPKSYAHIEPSNSYSVNGREIVVFAKQGDFLLRDLKNSHLKDIKI